MSDMDHKTYIGLDLSLTGTGVVELNDGGYGASTIKSKPIGDTPTHEIRRLITIRDAIIGKIPKDVGMVAIEGLAYMARNTTALVQLAGLNYMIREFLLKEDIPFIVVPPSTLKKYVTGKGNCDKSLVLLKVYENFGVSMDNDNTADAYGLAHIVSSIGNRTGKLHAYQEDVLNMLTKQL